MSEPTMTYDAFVDEVYSLFFDNYGVFKIKAVTENRLRRAHRRGISPRKFANDVAMELRLVKL